MCYRTMRFQTDTYPFHRLLIIKEKHVVQITLSAELKSVVDDIAEVSDYLWEKGWAARNAGNVSVNVTNLIPTMSQKLPQFPKVAMKNIPAELTGHYFMVTTTGSRCRELAREP